MMLDDYQIKAQLTATPRTGVHKYTYPKDADGRIILDLSHGIYNYDGKVLWANLRVENDTLLTGYRIRTVGHGPIILILPSLSHSRLLITDMWTKRRCSIQDSGAALNLMRISRKSRDVPSCLISNLIHRQTRNW